MTLFSFIWNIRDPLLTICSYSRNLKRHLLSYMLTENLLGEGVKPVGKWCKYLTLNYVKINAGSLIYTPYMAIRQISPKIISQFLLYNTYVLNQNPIWSAIIKKLVTMVTRFCLFHFALNQNPIWTAIKNIYKLL